MGAGAMLVLLGLIVAFVPMILRWLNFSVAGFGDMEVEAVPQPAAMRSSQYTPDANTSYLCRSPNDSGTPCPEGEFCDGTRQACEKKTVPSMMDQVVGYFS